MHRESVGLLAYKVGDDGTMRYLLVHPGGPYWTGKDKNAWSIPKGELEQGEDALSGAIREFTEETGVDVSPDTNFEDIGSVAQRSGKVVRAWAFRISDDIDVSSMKSNDFEMEWPPKSGTRQTFKEVDSHMFFTLEQAKDKIVPAQAPLLERVTKSNPPDGGHGHGKCNCPHCGCKHGGEGEGKEGEEEGEEGEGEEGEEKEGEEKEGKKPGKGSGKPGKGLGKPGKEPGPVINWKPGKGPLKPMSSPGGPPGGQPTPGKSGAFGTCQCLCHMVEREIRTNVPGGFWSNRVKFKKNLVVMNKQLSEENLKRCGLTEDEIKDLREAMYLCPLCRCVVSPLIVFAIKKKIIRAP